MQTFQQYHEAFSFNPKNWFNDPKLQQQDNLLRSNARKHAQTSIKKLKDLLATKNYSIHKTNEGSYTVRSKRLVGLDPKDITHKIEAKRYKSDPVLNIPYIRALFTLAHEVGHVLQWNDATETKHQSDIFANQVMEAEKESPYKVKDVLHLKRVWYELNAWVEGMQFIPTEYKSQYKKYAYDSYKTYMDKNAKYYNSEMMLRNMLYQLNFDEQNLNH